MKKSILGTMVAIACAAGNANAMTELDDTELSAINGQALFNLTYQQGKAVTKASDVDASGNVIEKTMDQSGLGFYKLALSATMELNANIKKLALGCGGSNGNGACDIDIDFLSLSGVSGTSDGRVASSAVLTNPFVEFAIKNPTSAATREVAGFRLSAESIQGLLTFGLENGDLKSGINSFSGYMVTKETTGKVSTNAVTSGLTQTALQKAITGKARSELGAIKTTFKSDSYDLTLSAASGGLTLGSQEIMGKRITTANLQGNAVVSGINLGGTIEATTAICIIKCIGVSGDVSGTINNLGVNVTVSQNLGYFHKVDLNGTAASLSLQSQNLIWTDAKSVASKGWWLEMSNPIDIGDVTPAKGVDITEDVVKQALDKVSDYLSQDKNAVNCGVLATSCLLTGAIDTGTVNLVNQYVNMTLNDLVLANQNFASNCYGGLKFC